MALGKEKCLIVMSVGLMTSRVTCARAHLRLNVRARVISLREKNKLHFSPNCIFGELDFDNRERLIECFRDRIFGFYIEPAKLLDKENLAFSCGLLCAATIDSLARILYPDKKVGFRIMKWLDNNIAEFREDKYSERFYYDFRCGLVHEGRIKNPGEFSYDSEELVTRVDGVMRINPRRLLLRLERAVEKYLLELESDPISFSKFKEALEKDFEEEVRMER